MLDIIIVRYPEDCIHKAINGVPAEVENAICQHFKVLERPASWGMFCLSTGTELKEKCEQLSRLTEKHLTLKGLFQLLCAVKNEEKVVLLNARAFLAMMCIVGGLLWRNMLKGITCVRCMNT